MNAIQQLGAALDERNKKTNAFLEEIISIINESVDNLPFCTRANSTPEVAGSVKVLKRDLDAIISKIKDDKNIDKHAAEALVSRLKFSNVKRMPSGLTPRSSEVDGARFSDRSSYQSATGSPRSSTSSAYGTPRSSETGSPTYTPASTSPEFSLDRQLNPIPTGQNVRRPSEFGFGGKRFRQTKRR